MRCRSLRVCLHFVCRLLVLCGWAGARAETPPAAPATVSVRFVVTAPADTPPDATLYLAGSAPALGGWKADGLPLTKSPDGTWTATADLPPDTEFKITRGSWETVEKSAHGGERPNRTLAGADLSQPQRLAVALTVELTVALTVERWATGAASARPHTVVGDLQIVELPSAVLGGRRTLRIWLPPGYAADSAAASAPRYDVLYLHDGQNLFDRATSSFGNEWEIDETLTRLIAAQRVRPLIVVGIDNAGAGRIYEYTYVRDPSVNAALGAGRAGGGGAMYAKFLLTEVMPYVRQTYRVGTGPAHTFMGGSSLGALITFEIARRNPDTFGGILIMSPATWWADQAFVKDLEAAPGGLSGTRVWLDMGTAEVVATTALGGPQKYIAEARRLDAALTKHNIDHRLYLDEGASHNESAWARRFPTAIEYLFGQ